MKAKYAYSLTLVRITYLMVYLWWVNLSNDYFVSLRSYDTGPGPLGKQGKNK